MKKLYILALATLLAAGAQAQVLLTQADFTGVIVPQYMGSGGATRLPVAFRATVSNLTPSATYQYRTTAILPTSIGTTETSAGNSLSINDPNATYYTSTLAMRGKFTTDAAGSYTGWFALVNTANARFTAGNEVYPVLSLNSGSGQPNDTSTTAKRLVLDLSIKVLGFEAASGANNGTGIWGASQAPAKNFVALYDNEAGSGRPLAVTPTQALGITIFSAVPFYTSNVEGQNGAWGTIIPNTLASGVKRIASFDVATGAELGSNTSATGTWGSTNTANPSGGATTPLAISATDAPLITSILQPKTKELISVLPNPAMNTLTVQGLAPNETIKIQDMMGCTQSIKAVQGRLDVSSLLPGNYIITTSTGKLGRFVKID